MPAAPEVGVLQLVATATLAVLHGVLTLAYTIPTLAKGTAPATGGNRVSIVSYIDSLGPVWQIAFGLTCLGLVVALVAPQWLALAHTVGGAVVAVFAAALWFGWAVSDPRPSILSACGYTAMVVWHLTKGAEYARRTGRRPAGHAARRSVRVVKLDEAPAPVARTRRRA